MKSILVIVSAMFFLLSCSNSRDDQVRSLGIEAGYSYRLYIICEAIDDLEERVENGDYWVFSSWYDLDGEILTFYTNIKKSSISNLRKYYQIENCDEYDKRGDAASAEREKIRDAALQEIREEHEKIVAEQLDSKLKKEKINKLYEKIDKLDDLYWEVYNEKEYVELIKHHFPNVDEKGYFYKGLSDNKDELVAEVLIDYYEHNK